MKGPIKNAIEALDVATKIVVAQDKLLAAYRIGSLPSFVAIDYLNENRPRLEAWTESQKEQK